jgi:hypothetical protein
VDTRAEKPVLDNRFLLLNNVKNKYKHTLNALGCEAAAAFELLHFLVWHHTLKVLIFHHSHSIQHLL